MPRSKGDRLGPYEILALVGQGGMGEVYRAHDDRVRRDVAIKVSNAQFTERFAIEARSIAALNHTNICHLYDVGPNYLVMEYVEGEDLKGPLDFKDALPIIQQLIDGIEAAHEKNIVHRDLKPANIKITPEGVVKILDFGLAKAMDPNPPSGSNAANSPTLTIGATAVGTILGTAAYMAPEQARGKTADKRSDIWSFGVILFELLTGQKMFSGESAVETLGAVLNKDPDIAAAPARVQKLLRWCLEKDRKERLASISDARRLLSESGTEVPLQAESLPHTQHTKLWIGATAVLIAALGVALWAPWRTEPLKPLVRLEVDLGSDVALFPSADPGAAIILSPDGTRLVYVASVAGAPSRLYTRRLDQAKAAELPGTQGAQGPFFSPDGQWIGFATVNKYNKISVEGGAVVPLAEGGGLFAGAGAWGEDGGILLPGVLNAGLRRLPPAGGQVAKLADLGNGEIAHVSPQFLPGGKFALFVVAQAPTVDGSTIEAVSLADGKRKVVARGGATPLYLPSSPAGSSGHLVYVNKSTLFAIPFDAGKLQTSGNPVPILDDVKFSPTTNAADLSFSRNGTLVYRKGGAGVASNQTTIQWIDAAGKRSPLMAKGGDYQNPHLSPDAKRLALQVTEGGGQDIWAYDPQRDAMTRLTFGGAIYTSPVWSPDGRLVIFNKAGAGIFWTRADGSGQPELLVENKGIVVPWSMSPDGKRLAFFEVGKDTGWIHTVEVTEDGGGLKAGKPQRFFESKFTDASPEFSPDGRWIAYQTNESGRNEVVVRAFPAPASGQGGKWQVSTGGGTLVRWPRGALGAGRELLYQDGDRIMAVGYTVNGDSFVAEKPRVRIEKLGGTFWDVAPDGRIAVLTPVETAQAPAVDHTVVFLLNFFDELRRKVPLGK